MGKALEGLKVLDFSRILAAPFASMILGDLGAEVWKVERPGTGDDTRAWHPPSVNGQSCYYLAVNRNKKSLGLNLANPRGRELASRLALKADILLENFKTGTMAKYALDYATLSRLNPRLVYCSITGYGSTGPYARDPGFDVIAEAVGGFMGITGPKGIGQEPCKAGVAVTNLMTGLFAHGAILAALLNRERTGRGQKIECNLLSTQLAALTNVASNFLNVGMEGRAMGTEHESIAPLLASITPPSRKQRPRFKPASPQKPQEMIYGRRGEGETLEGQKLGVVIGTYGRGEVAHILYSGIKQPLYLVPASIFIVDPVEASTMSKREYAKRTTSPLSNSSNVEFGVEEDDPRIVRWFRKCPSYMAINWELNMPRIMSEGVTNGEQLWTRKFGITPMPMHWISALPINEPLQVLFEIDVDYGEGFNERLDEALPLQGFHPKAHFLPSSAVVTSLQDDESYRVVREAPWNQPQPQDVGGQMEEEGAANHMPSSLQSNAGAGDVAAFTRADLMEVMGILNEMIGQMGRLAHVIQRRLDSNGY